MLSLLVLGLVLSLPTNPRAHDIPADILVQLLVRPQGDRMRILVRVPVASMQDIVFPQRGPGYLDIPQRGLGAAERGRSLDLGRS